MVERLSINTAMNDEGDVLPIQDVPEARGMPTNRQIIRARYGDVGYYPESEDPTELPLDIPPVWSVDPPAAEPARSKKKTEALTIKPQLRVVGEDEGLSVGLQERALALKSVVRFLNGQASYLGRAEKLWFGDERQRSYYGLPDPDYDEYGDYRDNIMDIMGDLTAKAERGRNLFETACRTLSQADALEALGLIEDADTFAEEFTLEVELELGWPRQYADERKAILEWAERAAGMRPMPKPKVRRVARRTK